MAQEDIRLSGTFLNSSGNAISGETATLFREGTVTPAIATDTTDSDGEWDFTVTTPGRYDVQLVKGTETIRILARDKFQVTEIQARNPTTAQPALSAYSTTSEAASLVATFGFRPSTESSGVETADTPSDGDLGYIDFTLSNDHSSKQEWIAARIAWEGVDVSDGSEDGQFNFWAMTNGTLVEELHLSGAALWPETDAGLDLGKSALGFNDLHLGSGGVVNFDGGDVTLTHASNALTLAGGTFTVSGNTVLNGDVTLGSDATDVIAINGTVAGANAVIFEGNSGDGSETTLAVVDPTSDHTVYMPNQGGYLGVFDSPSTTQISSTPEELNILDGATVVVGEINALDLGSTAVGTAIASKAVVLDSNKDYTGIRNLTITGTLSDGNYTFDDSGNVSGLGTVGSGNITSSGTVQGTVITATTGFAPDASDGAYLGTSSLQFTDLFLADGAVINLGDDQDVTLTHVADTGVLLNSTRQLQFGDSGTYIHQSADGVLDLVSDTEIEINATTIDINGAVDISGNATVGGNLTINGTTTTVDTATLAVEDPLIALATGNSADSIDVGFYAKYVDSGTKYAGLFRDASDSDKWKLFATTGNSHEVPGTTVNTTSGFTLGTLVASAFEGDLTGDVTGDVTGNASGTAATVTGGTQASITTVANVTEVGALDAGSITSNFGNINIGASTFDTTGAVSTGNLSPAGDISTADAKYIKLGGSRMATAEPASNTTGYGVVIGFDSAGSVSAGDAVYINSSGKVAQANAQVSSVTDPCIGIATNAGGSDGDDVYVLTHGIWRMDAEAFTAGDPVYVGESAGALTPTAPSTDGDYVQRIGIAVSDDCVLVMPSIDVIEHA